MKNYLPLYVLCFAVFAVGLIHSCKKENQGNLVTTSYTEDFEDYNALATKGWLMTEDSEADTVGTTNWGWGSFGPLGKSIDTTWYGFAAYSYKIALNEYVYSLSTAIDSNLSLSSWLLTPVLSVKNGDKISFYTRGDTTGTFTDRMQVLLNPLASTNVGHDLYTVGDFTTVLDDINKDQAPGGYPTSWTKYEYTLSGISGQKNIRIAFRHYVVSPKNARGVGIDLFKYEVN